MSNEKYLNCSLIASEEGPLTLQEIGDCFGLSRMRICQIEKGIFKKIRKNYLNESDLK
jgi:DNA-directed RNA polymerase sigma subunit (sigma70/sigma32)